VVGYSYDYQNRLVRKALDSDGDGTVDSSTIFVYDGNQIALQFDHTGTSDVAAADLSHRYLWGSAVDQLLADEHVEELGTAGDVVWPLTDNLNTVRDLATYNSGADTTTVADHRVYDAYGNLKSETNSAVDCVFGFTGRMLDKDTGLQNNHNRWYDAKVGRWMSNDPIGLAAGDANLGRYVGNSPTNWIDPSGLKAGDEFKSPDDAARNWKETYRRLTAKDHRERGSTIYRTKDGSFSYSEPAVATPNDPHEVEPSLPPRGTKVAGVIHSHTVDNTFSDWDVQKALEILEKLKSAIPEYLDTPNDDLLKMDLNNKKEPVTSIKTPPSDQEAPRTPCTKK
jgi:RHS repeat-associated protein